MAEYYDLSTNINLMVGTLEENNYPSVTSFFASFLPSFLGFTKSENSPQNDQHSAATTAQHKPKLDKQLLKVRNSICVVGHNHKAVQYVKQKIASLVDEPLPLESLHIQKASDIQEGALMVPKVILVATHCPGKKLLDDDGDTGQLDLLYDRVCDVGADLLVVYLGLPRSIYPTVRHMVYHPRMSEIVFPTQPTLRSLAEEYSLITVLEKTDLSSMQKNVIREWLARPVEKDHPVYENSEKLIQMTFSDAEFWSESELYRYQRTPVSGATQYASAYEFQTKPEVHKTKTKTKKKKGKSSKKSKGDNLEEVPLGQLIDFGQGEADLEMYNGESAQGSSSQNDGAIGDMMV